MINKIYTLIGNLLSQWDSYRLRLINYYKLSKLGSHGKNCHIEGNVNISFPNMHIGDNVFIPSGCTFLSSDAKIIIGDNVMFGPNVMIATGNHRCDVVGEYMINVSEKRDIDDKDVVISNDVWIGMNAIILKGVHIGEGSVIGAGAIVTSDIPPYSVVTCSRCVMIRKRFSDEEIQLHKSILNI